MKLSKEALAEIVAILHEGLSGNKDVSQAFRDLDLDIIHGIPEVEGGKNPDVGKLTLSKEYVATHPRGGTWVEN
jgi:hypothetical protein